MASMMRMGKIFDESYDVFLKYGVKSADKGAKWMWDANTRKQTFTNG